MRICVLWNISQLHGQINNDNMTDSEKNYTNGTPEWVDLSEVDNINFRHSVDLRTILQAYISLEEIKRIP